VRVCARANGAAARVKTARAKTLSAKRNLFMCDAPCLDDRVGAESGSAPAFSVRPQSRAPGNSVPGSFHLGRCRAETVKLLWPQLCVEDAGDGKMAFKFYPFSGQDAELFP
jgi:hypothetical protein